MIAIAVIIAPLSLHFYNLTAEVTYRHFFHILLVTLDLPSKVWEGTIQGYEIPRGVGITGTILEGSYTDTERKTTKSKPKKPESPAVLVI